MNTVVIQVYRFIHNTVGQYVHIYTKLHTRTINKHTCQYRIKYVHKYRYEFTLLYVI